MGGISRKSLARYALCAALGILLLSSAVARQAVATASCDTIAYRPDDRLVNVPVTINGSQLWFDVDTGARHSVIDLAAAKRLGLPLIKPARMSGAGRGTAELLHTSPVEIRAGNTSVHVAEPWVLDLSHTGTSRRIDGLVGVDFFKAYAVRIDPEKQTIAFCNGVPFPSGASGATIPLIVTNDRFFIYLKLALPNGVAATHRVRVDTGSGDAVSDDLVRQSPARRKSTQGVGLGTPYVQLFRPVRKRRDRAVHDYERLGAVGQSAGGRHGDPAPLRPHVRRSSRAARPCADDAPSRSRS